MKLLHILRHLHHSISLRINCDEERLNLTILDTNLTLQIINLQIFEVKIDQKYFIKLTASAIFSISSGHMSGQCVKPKYK